MVRICTLIFVLAGACSVPSDPELYSDDKDPPVRMAPAKATATQFLSIFKALCLESPHNQSEMQAIAAKLRFRKNDHLKTGVVGAAIDLELHKNSSLKLDAEFGKSSLVWDGLHSGGSFTFQTCKLRGHVADPQNLTAEALRAEYKSEIAFAATENQSNQNTPEGTLKIQNNGTRAIFRLPYIYSVDADSYVVGADRCRELPSCRVWREVEFELFLPEEGAQFFIDD